MAEAEDILLNPFQLEATENHYDKNIMILAPPGSGKTLTLIHRIYNLITKNNVKPSEILALTFTNKAAGELKSRLLGMQNIDINDLASCTFHSLGNTIVKKNYKKIGFSVKPKIIKGKDQAEFIASTLLEMFQDKTIEFKNNDPEDLLEDFRGIKHMRSLTNFNYDYRKEIKDLIQVISIAKGDEAFLVNQSENFQNFIKNYNQKLKNLGMIDFTDMLSLAAKVYERYPELKRKDFLVKKYILVDEFQDTSNPQMRLLNVLAGDNAKITVCGDDDQMIYRFCGVSDRLFFDYQQRYSAEVVTLEENYRSTSLLIEAYVRLINYNTNRYQKSIVTRNPEGQGITYMEFGNVKDECLYVAKEIKKLHLDQGIPYQNIAVLCRIKHIIKEFSKTLSINGIPIAPTASQSFNKDEEFIISFIKFFLDHKNESALKSVLYFKQFNINRRKIFLLPHGNMFQTIQNLSDSFPSFKRFIQLLDFMEQQIYTNTPNDFINILAEKMNLYINNLDYYGRSILIGGREGLEDFLNIIEGYEMKKKDYVNCGTVHSAKGKEWDVVFVIRMNEFVSPARRHNDVDIEEERRIAYVAMSRSKRFLYVTWLSQEDNRRRVKSRFVDEMVRNRIENQEEAC